MMNFKSELVSEGRSGRKRLHLACAGWLYSVAFIAAPVLAADAAGVSTEPGSEWRATVRQFALEHFKQPAWGFTHSERDYLLARELATADKVHVDDDVLYAAAYLHDMGAFAPWARPDPDHADVAADVVETVLKDTGFPMTKLDAVRGAIRTHMYDRQPVGPEALYLHDADALDWLGAIGVARIIALTDPNGGAPTILQLLPKLQANLEQVPSRVLSPAGRARVEGRRRELESFLAELRRESDDYRAL
jgi:uncharacterized protein